jgi:hypothetical protein
VAILALAVVGAYRIGRSWMREPWVWGGLCVASLTLVHAVYWTNMRMRAPVMPIVCVAAAAVCPRKLDPDEYS